MRIAFVVLLAVVIGQGLGHAQDRSPAPQGADRWRAVDDSVAWDSWDVARTDSTSFSFWHTAPRAEGDLPPEADRLAPGGALLVLTWADCAARRLRPVRRVLVDRYGDLLYERRSEDRPIGEWQDVEPGTSSEALWTQVCAFGKDAPAGVGSIVARPRARPLPRAYAGFRLATPFSRVPGSRRMGCETLVPGQSKRCQANDTTELGIVHDTITAIRVHRVRSVRPGTTTRSLWRSTLASRYTRVFGEPDGETGPALNPSISARWYDSATRITVALSPDPLRPNRLHVFVEMTCRSPGNGRPTPR
jgi:hypothetical protein